MTNAFNVWKVRLWGPAIAYSMFFSIAYIMAWSAMIYSGGTLSPISTFDAYNMNAVIGNALADIFGTKFVFFAAWLGLFGAMVGGSEAGSNVLFYPIQKQAATNLGYSDTEFMTIYGAHANSGGVASAITPSKINNAVAVIKGDPELESQVMQKHMAIVILITIVIGFMTVGFLAWGI